MEQDILAYKKGRSYKILFQKNRCADFSTYSEEAYHIKEVELSVMKECHAKDVSWQKSSCPQRAVWIEYTEQESKWFDEQEEICVSLAHQSYEILEEIVEYLKSRQVIANIQYMFEDTLKVFYKADDFFPSQKQKNYYCIVQMSTEIDGESYRRVFTCGQSDGKITELIALKKRIHDYVEKNWVNAEHKTLEEFKPGIYDIIMSPEIAALFMHEAVGHLLEADNFTSSDLNLKVGEQIGEEILNVIDDPTLAGLSGSSLYDDEGELTKEKYLIRKGRIEQLLANTEYDGKFANTTKGNARAKDCNSEILIRMSNTYIKPGIKDIQPEIERAENVIYLDELLGGNTNQNLFYISAGKIIGLQNGKKEKEYMGRTIILPILDTVKKICFVGNQLVWINGGLCGKQNQNLSVSMGSPHIMIKNIEVK